MLWKGRPYNIPPSIPKSMESIFWYWRDCSDYQGCSSSSQFYSGGDRSGSLSQRSRDSLFLATVMMLVQGRTILHCSLTSSKPFWPSCSVNALIYIFFSSKVTVRSIPLSSLSIYYKPEGILGLPIYFIFFLVGLLTSQSWQNFYQLMNLFLFHRDLRLVDNTSLIKQVLRHKKVTPIFIFHTSQIQPEKNPYFSHNSVQFMVDCLKELEQDISRLKGKLYFFHGDNLQVLKEIHKKHKIGSIYFNYDYTPFAKARDQEIEEWGKKEGIEVCAEEDYLLYPLLGGQTLSPKSQKPYLVFTPFKNYCLSSLAVRKPDNFKFQSQHLEVAPALETCKLHFQSEQMSTLFEFNKEIRVMGGREKGLQILSQIAKFKNYNKDRNWPSIPTTCLSAYLHFTPISPREVYHAVFSELGEANNIVNELHWRDFYANITHYFPRVLLPPANSFQSKFDEVKWKYNPAQLSAWKEGRTGFPIVDAAMRELNTTGFMHNRCRMIVASFFAKDLFLDWHEGEKYFASKLVDYSPMQNSGGWQWTVGNGTDAQPYFRIFNPWTQQANYDPQCAYIKKWLPELKGLSAEDIHNWSKVSDAYIKKGIQYPRPIINHDEARKETLAIYSSTFKKVQSTDK